MVFDEQKCKVCGCTELAPCFDKDNEPCSWITTDLCSACVVEAPNTNKALPFESWLVEKECRFCNQLQEGSLYKLQPTFTCGKRRFDAGIPVPGHHYFFWSGIYRRNKIVRKAEIHCPDWELFPRFQDVNRLTTPVRK
jgi:hypothetical protein